MLRNVRRNFLQAINILIKSLLIFLGDNTFVVWQHMNQLKQLVRDIEQVMFSKL